MLRRTAAITLAVAAAAAAATVAVAAATAAAPAPQPVCFQFVDSLDAVASADASLGTTSRASWRLPFDFTYLYSTAFTEGEVFTCGSRHGTSLSLVGQRLSNGETVVDVPVKAGEPYYSLAPGPSGVLYALQRHNKACPNATAGFCFVRVDLATGKAMPMKSAPGSLTGAGSCVPVNFNGVHAYARGVVAPDGAYVTLWECDRNAGLVEVRVHPGGLGSSSRVVKGVNASEVRDFWVDEEQGHLYVHRDLGVAGHAVHQVLASGALSPRTALRVANAPSDGYVKLAPVRGGFCLASTPRNASPVFADLACSYGATDGVAPQFVTSRVTWYGPGVFPANSISDAVPC